MKRGFVYLFAVIDWANRRVLSWRLSNTLTVGFCIEAVQEAINKHGKPDIFNTDQDCQFTSLEFTGLLKDITVSRSVWTARVAGVTMCLSNGFGRASNTKKYICTPTTVYVMQKSG
jgi:transposase InsO family protein